MVLLRKGGNGKPHVTREKRVGRERSHLSEERPDKEELGSCYKEFVFTKSNGQPLKGLLRTEA